ILPRAPTREQTASIVSRSPLPTCSSWAVISNSPKPALSRMPRTRSGLANANGPGASGSSVMRKPLEGTSVLIERIEHGRWAIGGAQVQVAAQVGVILGVGTNSTNEKANFMAEMMTLLRAVLGQELRGETYIVLHEIGHDSYGRVGLTRAERDRR